MIAYVQSALSLNFRSQERGSGTADTYGGHDEDGIEVVHDEVAQDLELEFRLLGRLCAFQCPRDTIESGLGASCLGLLIALYDRSQECFQLRHLRGKTLEPGVERGQPFVERLWILEHVHKTVHGVIQVGLDATQLRPGKKQAVSEKSVGKDRYQAGAHPLLMTTESIAMSNDVAARHDEMLHHLSGIIA